MVILSHRGYWKLSTEKNQISAFVRSFNAGFGSELDVRDCAGKILISHDMPVGTEILFEDVLNIMAGRNLPLAINIKADGLSEKIKKILQKYNHTNYFCFDMSIPDMVFQLKKNMKVFSGLSDIIPQAVLFDEAEGVWLDCFYDDWYDAERIDTLINQGKKVCVVSAELHGRDPSLQWTVIKSCKNFSKDTFMLCTDLPEKAQRIFS